MAEVHTGAPDPIPPDRRTVADTPRQDPAQPSPEAPRVRGLRRWLSAAPEITVLGLCVVFWIPTNGFESTVGGPGPAMYPRILISLLALAMLVRLLQHYRETRVGTSSLHTHEETALEEGVEFDESLIDSRRVWVAVAFSVGYVFATLYLGWLIATFFLTIAFLVASGKRKLLPILGTALVFAFGLSYVFIKIVYISLPTGAGIFDVVTVRLYELMGIY